MGMQLSGYLSFVLGTGSSISSSPSRSTHPSLSKSFYLTFNSLWNIFAARRSAAFTQLYSLPHFLSHLLWYPVTLLLFLLLADALRDQPRISLPLMYAFGFAFVLVTFRCMLSGITKHRFNPLRRTILVTWVTLLAIIIWVKAFEYGYLDHQARVIAAGLWMLALGNLLSVMHMYYHVFSELREILGIQMFSIPVPTKKAE